MDEFDLLGWICTGLAEPCPEAYPEFCYDGTEEEDESYLPRVANKSQLLSGHRGGGRIGRAPSSICGNEV